jgi:glycosyltransferase involved in cell wall biosynthesis
MGSVRNEIKLCNFPIEIIVIDGGSMDGSIEWLVKQKDIITIVQHNNGMWNGQKIDRKSWGFFMNLGFKNAHGKYVCMISDDCLIVPGAIKNGYELFERKLKEGEKVGALAFYWRNWPEQKKYNVGLTIGKKLFVNHGMYLRTALEEVNFIDEESFFFYYGDSDLCLKLWNSGYECIESPDSYIEHFSHAFNSKNKGPRSKPNSNDKEIFLKKWKNIFYDSKENYSGGWIEKEYEDPDKTSELFNIHKIILDFKQKFFIVKMMNKFKNIFNKNKIKSNKR